MKVTNSTGAPVDLPTVTTLDGVAQPTVPARGVIDVDEATAEQLVDQGWSKPAPKKAAAAKKAAPKTEAPKAPTTPDAPSDAQAPATPKEKS